MTASNDQVFEDLVNNFAKVEQDENRNVEEQETTKEEDKAADEGKNPKQGDKEKTQIKKLSEEELPKDITVTVTVGESDLRSILNLVPGVEIELKRAAELLVEDLISRYLSVEYFDPDDLREIFEA